MFADIRKLIEYKKWERDMIPPGTYGAMEEWADILDDEIAELEEKLYILEHSEEYN